MKNIQGRQLLARGKPKMVGIYGVISERVLVADFTDDGGASGFIDLTEPLPAGALPIGWKCEVNGGFGGDTSAVVQVGVEGDTDRFSADTDQSVFAVGTVGSLTTAAGACNDIDTAISIRVTVTGNIDFTAIVNDENGDMTVSFYFLQSI